MKLDSRVENFLKHNAPTWYENLQNDKYDNLGDKAGCVMGELYGWTATYDDILCTLYEDNKKCDSCTSLGNTIAKAGTAYPKWVARHNGTEYADKLMNSILILIKQHVEEDHPELLKQEKQIAA